jgi:hypothetical protein
MQEHAVRNLGMVGLFLIPAGVGLMAEGFEIAGGVVLGAGWLFALIPVIVVPVQRLRGRFDHADYPTPWPTFIIATAAGAAGEAADRPEFGLVVAYIALLWFYARWLA